MLLGEIEYPHVLAVYSCLKLKFWLFLVILAFFVHDFRQYFGKIGLYLKKYVARITPKIEYTTFISV